jgi:hypothetical protein
MYEVQTSKLPPSPPQTKKLLYNKTTAKNKRIAYLYLSGEFIIS